MSLSIETKFGVRENERFIYRYSQSLPSKLLGDHEPNKSKLFRLPNAQ